MINSRPLGITIIAGLIGLFAFFGLCGSLTGLGFAPFAVFGQGGLGAMFSHGFQAIVGLVLALGGLFIAWGLWTLQPWAFWATVILEVLNLFNGGLSWSMGLRGAMCGINIVPLLILAYLLLDKNVRAAFRT